MLETGSNIQSNYTLSIRLSTDGFSFVHGNPGNLSSFKHKLFKVEKQAAYLEKLRTAINKLSFLKKGTQTDVNILVEGDPMMVPPGEYTATELTELYAFGHGASSGVKLLTNTLSCHTMEVFPIDAGLYIYLSQRFPHAQYYASITPVMEHFLPQKGEDAQYGALYAYLHENKLSVFVLKEDAVLYSNQFTLTHREDAPFFILSVWKTLKMNQNRDSLYIMSDVPADGVIRELTTFVAHVMVVNPRTDFPNSPIARKGEIQFDMQTLINALIL
jgi:hypothetical protein